MSRPDASGSGRPRPEDSTARLAYLSQLLQTNAGGASPGSTITELNSPQRPHCLDSLVGSFTIGLVAAVTARSALGRSSALVSAGPRPRSLMSGPSLVVPVAPLSLDLPCSGSCCVPACRCLPHERLSRQYR